MSNENGAAKGNGGLSRRHEFVLYFDVTNGIRMATRTPVICRVSTLRPIAASFRTWR
jgi:hypothetical protein